MPINFDADASIICNPPGTADRITDGTLDQLNVGGGGGDDYQCEFTVDYDSVPAGFELIWRPVRSFDDPVNDGKQALIDATGHTNRTSALNAAFATQVAVSGTGTYTGQSGANLKLGREYTSMGFLASTAFKAAYLSGAREISSGVAGEVWPVGDALFRIGEKVTIQPVSAGVTAASDILFTGSVTQGAVAGVEVGDLSVTPGTAVGGTFSKLSGNAAFGVSGSKIVIASGQVAPAPGNYDIGVRYDNTSAGGGVHDDTITVTVLAATASITRIGRYTPATAQGIPVPGASNGTYGPFTVASGVATWASVPITAGTYNIGANQIIVSGDTQTVAHILDAEFCHTWTSAKRAINCDPEAIRRSMGLSDPDDLVDIVSVLQGPGIPGITYNASTRTVNINSGFKDQELDGFLFEDVVCTVNAGATGVTITNCAFRLTLAQRNTFKYDKWLGINANIAELSYCQFIQPLDFGFPAVVFGMGSNVISVIRYNWIGDHGGDALKPHNGNSACLIERNYFGCGGATTGRFRGNYSSGTAYQPGDYVKRGVAPNTGFFRCLVAHTGQALPSENKDNSNGRNTYWYWYDPHADIAQTAQLSGPLTFRKNVVNAVPRDNAGFGTHSNKGLVDIFRFINRATNPGVDDGTFVCEDNLLLRNADVNRPFLEIGKEGSGAYWPNGMLTIRRNAIAPANWDSTTAHTSRSQFVGINPGVTSAVLNAACELNVCASNGEPITAAELA